MDLVAVIRVQVLHLQQVHRHQQVIVIVQLQQVQLQIQLHIRDTRGTVHIADIHDTVHTLDITGIEDKNVKWEIPLSTFFF